MTRLFMCLITMLAACVPSDAPQDTPDAPAPETTPAPARQQVILFVGTSLTAGYGLTPEEAFPAVIQAQLDSAGLPYIAVNAGVSGASSAEGLARIGWLLRQPVDVLFLELGANDGLRGTSVEAMVSNLQAIIDSTRAQNPNVRVVIAGMEAPPNLGGTYTEAFRRAFRDLATRNDAALIPFLLEGVAGVDSLNQADGIHPTEDGHRIVAETVWRILQKTLS
ncbi:MAG: arylesterase [Gemmatimonadales bacterium]